MWPRSGGSSGLGGSGGPGGAAGAAGRRGSPANVDAGTARACERGIEGKHTACPNEPRLWDGSLGLDSNGSVGEGSNPGIESVSRIACPTPGGRWCDPRRTGYDWSFGKDRVNLAAKRSPSWFLTVIRSGETTWEAENRLRGATDLPLSEPGRVQARAMAALMRPGIEVIAHPSDEAATETAAILAAAIGARARAVEDMADPHLGLLEGLTFDAFSERYPSRQRQWAEDVLSVSPPEGEEIQAARGRIFRAIAGFLRRSKTEETAIVLHPIALGLLRCYFAQRPASNLWRVLAQGPQIERYLLSREAVAKLAEVPVLAAAG